MSINKVLLLIVLFVILIYQECGLYQKGLRRGEAQYKQSHRMYMTLKSAYHYGYKDCQAQRCESWEGDCDE
jgi:hypothetical protein